MDSPDDRDRVLVTGATGYIGGRLVPELLDAGLRGALPGPSPAKLDGRPWTDRVEVVRGRRHGSRRRPGGDGRRRRRLLPRARHGRDRRTSQHVTGPAAATFRDAAARPASAQLVYLGGLGRDDAALSEHLSSRHDVGAMLADGPVPVTELRAAVIIGSGSASFEMLRHLTEVLPVMVTPRWVRTRCQPIAIRDVLAYLVGVLGERRRARPGARDRRSRRRHLRGDDAALRRGRRSAPTGRGAGAGADTASVVVLGRPGDAAAGRAGPAAGRQPRERGGRARRRDRAHRPTPVPLAATCDRARTGAHAATWRSRRRGPRPSCRARPAPTRCPPTRAGRAASCSTTPRPCTRGTPIADVCAGGVRRRRASGLVRRRAALGGAGPRRPAPRRPRHATGPTPPDRAARRRRASTSSGSRRSCPTGCCACAPR